MSERSPSFETPEMISTPESKLGGVLTEIENEGPNESWLDSGKDCLKKIGVVGGGTILALLGVSAVAVLKETCAILGYAADKLISKAPDWAKTIYNKLFNKKDKKE